MAKGNGIEVNKGDNLTIRAMGITVTGVVAEVDYYGRDGWQIELTQANVPGGYSSWKQRHDGGNITHINGKAVSDNNIKQEV